MTQRRKILLLQTRNLGDCVIGTALLETIRHGLPSARIDILTRPGMRSIFEGNPGVNKVYTGTFPMGSLSDFGVDEMLEIPRLLRALRSAQYTDVANCAGDFREEWLARIISSGNNWSPGWAEDHPCRKVHRQSWFPVANRRVSIETSQPSIYDAVTSIGLAMGATTRRGSALYDTLGHKIEWTPAATRTIGIHPTASQPSRRWPMENWFEVAKALLAEGAKVHIFGSAAETEEFKTVFAGLESPSLQLESGSLSKFFTKLSNMDVLLCHDSLAAHTAHAIGVPIVLLNGSNDAAAWAPPGSTVLANGPRLACYPCHNRPTCIGSSHQYDCVQTITVESVLLTTQKLLDGYHL